jgi:hypothetical protein
MIGRLFRHYRFRGVGLEELVEIYEATEEAFRS